MAANAGVLNLLKVYNDQVKTLRSTSTLLNGHVISIALSFNQRVSKIPLVIKYCREKLEITVSEKLMEKVWEEYRNFSKSISRPNTLPKLKDFFTKVFLPATAIAEPAVSKSVASVDPSSKRSLRALKLQNCKLALLVKHLEKKIEPLKKKPLEFLNLKQRSNYTTRDGLEKQALLQCLK